MLTSFGGTRIEVQAFGPFIRCQGVALTKNIRPSHRSVVQVSAGKEKDKLQEQVKEVNEVLKQAGAELQRQFTELHKDRLAIVSEREKQLWERQDALLARWDVERAACTARETTLLQQLSRMQDTLVLLATNSADRRSTSHLSESSQSPAGSSVPRASGSRPSSPSPRSVLNEAAAYMPDNLSSEPSTTEASPLNGSRGSEDSASNGVGEFLQAAFNLASSEDVLEADFSEHAIGQQVTKQGANGHDLQAQHRPSNGSEQGASQPTSGPPTLSQGADDIFWMSQLHGALMQASFYPGEEDIEDWHFGDQTKSAVLTFQASHRLPETGIVDDLTWSRLLGPDYRSIRPPSELGHRPAAQDASPQQSLVSGAVQSRAMDGMAGDTLDRIRSLRATSELENRRRSFAETALSSSANEELSSFPVLREGDGGRTVHQLHVALERKGFIPDEEEQRWWMFGSSTHDCAITLQACSGLPETGVVGEETWLALLEPGATPTSLLSLTNEHEQDLAEDGAVWLLGEQRWERARR